MTSEEYHTQVQILKKMAYHYYVLDEPIATDEQYDKLYHQILVFEKSNPHLIDFTSPTQRVGDTPLESFSKNSHIQRMWSLEDVFNTGYKESTKSILTRLSLAHLSLMVRV